MSTETALVEIPSETALQVYTTPGAIDPYLAQIKAEVDKFGTGDVSTKKGRDAIASFAHKLAKSRTYLDDKIGKALSAEAKDIPRKIDATRKYLRETLEGWQETVRAPLTAWEEAEEARVNGIKADLAELEGTINDTQERTAEVLRDRLREVGEQELTREAFAEYFDAAWELKCRAVEVLEQRMLAAEKREADAAELARLREAEALRLAKEQQAREAQEIQERKAREAEEQRQREEQAAERARQEEAQKAQQEREAAAQREADLKAAAEKAEADRIAAEKKAAQDKLDADERIRKAEAAAKEKAEREQREKDEAERLEAEKREANKKHRAKINNAAVAAFVAGGMTEETAKLAVTLIAQKAIPAITVSY